ncbi:MAG: hypothetical protein DMC59_03090 [Verrucomicrobia bacterium]|nr:MAG: hypothetical protein DMC59_03090 [Verrucomicrobiota bacterium]
MALIHCYDCGKEISSLATACPSCGAPPRSTIGTPPLPTQASRPKQFFLGTIALLTGVVLVLVIRVLTYEPKNLSVATSPTPTTAGATTTSSLPVETASQNSPSIATMETPAGGATTTSSLPVETAAQSSPSLTTRETPAGGTTTTNSPAVEVASQSSPSLATAETPTGKATTTSSPPVEVASQSSPSLATTETPYASDVSVATAPPRRATYQVIGIPPSDYLNVRGGAGSDYEVVTKLEPGTGGILLGTKRVAKGATTWQEITVNGQTGWVNAAYIGLETQAPTSPTESSTVP